MNMRACGRMLVGWGGESFSTVEVAQYSGRYNQYMRGITSVLWGITSVLWRITLVLWRDSFTAVGDNSSTCGG